MTPPPERRGFAAAALLLLLAACAPAQAPKGPADDVPAMRWDHRPEAEHWTLSTMSAIGESGPSLLAAVPSDIDEYCPGYESADADDRAAFWTALFSAIAQYESTWNPAAIGGGGKYHGLLQILPATARWVGCEDGSLLDGGNNLQCAVRIANRRVAVSDGTVHSITADWGPMHWSDKRAQMASWTREQSYCSTGRKPSGPLAFLRAGG